jgi:serine/threonine-protein kinase
MANDVGGNVTLPARSGTSSFSATAADNTEYSYGQGNVTITTASKTFNEPTTVWEAGNSSSLSSPGDLGLSTRISYPACDDSVMIVYGTSWNSATNADAVQKLLDAHPGSSYMRTDLSCRAFTGPSTANSEGAYVYAVYSVESSQDAACKAISGTPNYGRLLSNSRDSGDNKLQCG